MNQITELPGASPGFGHEFNYAVWTAGTSVTLANVPWNNDYRDIVRFADQDALDTYLLNGAGPTITTTGMTYAALGQPIRLDIPFNRANTFNYLRAYNPAQPVNGGDTGRAFYYFVTDVHYVAPNTTRLTIQLDVWQTFGYQATFGNCYIERGHIGVANQNAFSDNGREFLTQPEGLDVGGEYQIVDQWQRTVAGARGYTATTNNYSILVTTTVPFDVDPGTVDAPKLTSSKGSSMENLPNGAETYAFVQLAHFREFMAAFADKPWITQGIISIVAVPHIGEYEMQTTASSIAGVTILKVDGGSLVNKSTTMKSNWRNTLPLPARYAHLDKFKVYPYCALEMTSYTGTPLVLKPESWSDPNATVVEVPHFSQPGPRLMFYPYRYNAANPGAAPTVDSFGVVNDGGEFLDMATGILNLPTFSTVNNAYTAFMAANNSGIAFQHSSADWSQQRALAGGQLASDQATGAIGTSQGVNSLGVDASQARRDLANTNAALSGVQAGINAVGGIGNGPGGAISAATGMVNAGIGTAMNINNNNMSTDIANNLSRGSNRLTNEQAGYVRDTNHDYANMAAKGDYQNAIAGINARVQDAKLIQPTTSGQVGGDAFTLATYKWGYDIKVKMLQSAAMHSIGEYWLRYGYSVNRFGRMPSSFMVCDKFTYWKLRETYITSSNCPETFKQALRGIFEKGVTVWKNPSDIGQIDIADNAPLAGVVL